MAKDFKSMERAIALILGTWWGVPFRRTPSSGAWNTQSRNMGHGTTDFHGDIVAPPEANFPFSVECKAYKEVEIYKALYGKSNVYDFWKQCRVDAKAAGKHPMLVVKENRKQPLVGISWTTYKLLFLANSPNTDLPVIRLQWVQRGKPQNLFLMDLHAFVAALDPKQVKKVLNG